MLLYAGITSFSFKYLNILQILVSKLKQRSQSAGNLVFNFIFCFINKKFYKFLNKNFENVQYLINFSMKLK